MAIKIRKDGVVQDLVINANEVRVLDKDGNFRSKNLETVLKELNMNGGSGGGTGTGGSGYPKDAEYVYVKDSEPDMDGVWFDESDVSSQPIVGDNSVVKAIREYIDTDVKAIVDKNDKIVQDIKTKVGDKLDVVGQLSNPNLLINGDFQVWQRGTSFKVINKYTADRWKSTRSNGIPNVVKHDKGLNIFTDTQGARASIAQPLEDSLVQKLKGKTVVLSAKIFSPTESTCSISIDVDTGSLGEYQMNVGTSGDILVKTYNIPSNATSITISANNRSGVPNQNIIIEWIKLELGSVATPFVPRLYGEELALCQRYYEKSSVGFIRGSVGNDRLRTTLSVSFKTQKRVVPSVSIFGYNTNTKNTVNIPNVSSVYPVNVYSINEFGIFGVDLKGENLVEKVVNGTIVEIYGWEADAEIY